MTTTIPKQITVKQMNKYDTNHFDYEPITTDNGLNCMAYPTGHIGALGDVVRAVARATQKDEAMAGQAVISALAGATQARYQVFYFNDIGNVPLSLFTLTIAKSAHGKSHVSKLCNQTLRAVQERLYKQYKHDCAVYENADKAEKIEKPVNPLFIFNSGTIEGLIDVIERNGYCYALIDEMATMLGGHSAKPENIMKLLGSISSLWSSGIYSDVRRGNDDPRQVNGDLTLSANGQPQIIKPMFTSPLWREQGAMPRFLVCEPPVKKAKRTKGQKIDENDQQVIETFNNITRAIFEVTPCSEGKYTTKADDAAETLLMEVFNEMNKRSDADCLEIESFALRATEHAGRLAGLLSVYRSYFDCEPMETLKGDLIMTKEDALGGIILMRYYLHEYNRLSTGDFGVDTNKMALELFAEIKTNPNKWQTKQPGYISKTAYNQNIGRYRTEQGKQKAKAFRVLEDNNYIAKQTYKDDLNRVQYHWVINQSIS